MKNTVARGDVALGTHSCKATLLLCMSKRGLPRGPRRLLGYHVSKGDSSMVIYSRDAMASPLRLMCSMLKEVKNDLFFPARRYSKWHAREPWCSSRKRSRKAPSLCTATPMREPMPWLAHGVMMTPQIPSPASGSLAASTRFSKKEGTSYVAAVSHNMELLSERPAFLCPVCATSFSSL